MQDIVRKKAHVSGIVQGVGFRPFVFRLAERHHVTGYVLNTPDGVEIEAEGSEPAVNAFLRGVATCPLPLVLVTDFATEEFLPKGDKTFVIRESIHGTERRAFISPDVSICEDCLRELFDPSDRRHRYPFINCTNCGPRFTIIRDIPYDRPNTTMAPFAMCPDCRREYEDPSDRRFHAQPNACWVCGPQLRLLNSVGQVVAGVDPVEEAARLLRNGAIIAVKGLGGFHLAVDATNDQAVIRLRERKGREEKPLAVMSESVDDVALYCELTEAERDLLTAPTRPIVLAKKRPGSSLAENVAPRRKEFGAMLPYTPLHYLILHEAKLPALVMTSANFSEEPIITSEQEAQTRLSEVADYFLVHDRAIWVRADDSVARVISDQPVLLRRSRGYAPKPILLKEPLPPILALGAELKNTICLTKGKTAFLSQHIGDLKNAEALRFRDEVTSHMRRILEIEPELIVYDLHPDFLSGPDLFSSALAGLEICSAFQVQHHHAHIASCMAEHGLSDPVIGLAMDGAGYGEDGTIWGGEVLVCDLLGYRRAAHLEKVALPGGDAAAEEPWRMALSYLYSVFGDEFTELDIPLLQRIEEWKIKLVVEMLRKQINTPLTSSLGRLFDAVAALMSIRDVMSYEGQAACELEGILDERETGCYSFELREAEVPQERAHFSPEFILSFFSTIREVVCDLQNNVPEAIISSKFHRTVAAALHASCLRVREKTSLNRVALSGGCFQNAFLTRTLSAQLHDAGFEIFSHLQVPPNDGCIALGQAVVAGKTYVTR